MRLRVQVVIEPDDDDEPTGHRQSAVVHEVASIERGELTVDEIAETIHPHPTLSEGLREAVLAVEGHPIHIPPKQTARAK